MAAVELKEKYDGNTSFCGGVDAQRLLVNGTPDQVYKKVMELKALFPTWLIILPGHEVILTDISPENIESLFSTASGS